MLCCWLWLIAAKCTSDVTNWMQTLSDCRDPVDFHMSYVHCIILPLKSLDHLVKVYIPRVRKQSYIRTPRNTFTQKVNFWSIGNIILICFVKFTIELIFRTFKENPFFKKLAWYKHGREMLRSCPVDCALTLRLSRRWQTTHLCPLFSQKLKWSAHTKLVSNGFNVYAPLWLTHSGKQWPG